MKKIISILLSIIVITGTTTFAAEIPRESAPLNATEEQICIVENLIGNILNEVQSENLGYTLATGYANTRGDNRKGSKRTQHENDENQLWRDGY